MDDATRPAATSPSSPSRKSRSAPPYINVPSKQADAWLLAHGGADPVLPDAGPLVSVLVEADDGTTEAETARAVIEGQRLTSWEVVFAGSHPDAAALSLAIGRCRGEYVAWLGPGTQWDPGRLARVVAAAQQADAEGAYDGLFSTAEGRGDRYYDREVAADQLLYRGELDPERLVARRSVVAELGVDESLSGAWLFDLTSTLVRRGRLAYVPASGVTRDDDAREQALAGDDRERPYPDYGQLPTAPSVVRNLRLLPWEDLAGEPASPGRVSLLVLVTNDEPDEIAQRAADCIAALEPATGDEVEVLLIGNGLAAEPVGALDALADGRAWLRVVHHPIVLARALALNLAATKATGATLVFLDDTCRPERGWLEPLLSALAGAAAAAPLVRRTSSGLIDNLGLAFPETGGLPHALLADFPVEDVGGSRVVQAVPGPVIAVRRADFAEARGFDPVFRNDLEYADLSLRLTGRSGQRLRVASESVVWRTRPDPEVAAIWARLNRSVFVDRWRAVRADARDLWRESQLEPVAYRTEEAEYKDRRILRQLPVLDRSSRMAAKTNPRSLRWAIKNPAPAGQPGAHWGDTHFTRHLADALRALGQEVVIDHRGGFGRDTGRVDDVALVLRGLAPYRPVWGQVTLGWLISHPELMARREAASYDRLFAASIPWAARRSADWALRIDPLLQATDPAVFHPASAAPDSGHDVLFVGGARRAPRPIVEMAVKADLPLTVYGGGWSELLPEGIVRAEYLPNDQLSAAYRSAGIVLSDQWAEMREEGFLANRLFDAAASAARVVSDNVGEVADLFGRSVVTVGSAEELAEIFRRDRDEVFGDDDERLEVAARIAREHSFAVRAQQLLDAALEIRAERGWSEVSDH